jgi:uracil-DNA glycosylase family 4
MNKPNNRQADPQLFENCREYIPGEIEVLKPDILVTQGDRAMDAIKQNFSAKVNGNQKQCGYAVSKLKDKNVLWLHSYHPSSYAGFNYQRQNCWSHWKTIVGQFWKDESRDRVAV